MTANLRHSRELSEESNLCPVHKTLRPQTGNTPSREIPATDRRHACGGLIVLGFLLHLPSYGSIILKLKSSGRKYSSISCASVKTIPSIGYISTNKSAQRSGPFSIATEAVLHCNMAHIVTQNGTYWRAKQAVLQPVLSAFVTKTVDFEYVNYDF